MTEVWAQFAGLKMPCESNKEASRTPRSASLQLNLPPRSLPLEERQGLKLDWIGLCWGGDFVWNVNGGWQLRTLQHGRVSKWRAIKNADKQTYRKNAYRVLLTRARQGMVLFVPRGDAGDLTTCPEEFDETARYLVRCGVLPLRDMDQDRARAGSFDAIVK
jgi:hypothetical protein